MDPPYQNPPSCFPLKFSKDHDDHILVPKPQASSSLLACPVFHNIDDRDHGGPCYIESHQLQLQLQQEVDITFPFSRSYNDPRVENESSESGPRFTVWKKEDGRDQISSDNGNSAKWMSSKMRLTRKMIKPDLGEAEAGQMNADQKLEDERQSSPLGNDNRNNWLNNSHSTIRVCADCHTTKTPLWRSGPKGPKTLCNACGIRQRKARRAMAAATLAANGTTPSADKTSLKICKPQQKEKRSTSGSGPQFRKRCKQANTTAPDAPREGPKKLCFEDITISLSKNSAFQRVFPQEEKEAAILLMALSYGLVHA